MSYKTLPKREVIKINIYEHRTQRGLTQGQLAYKVDVTQQAVAAWESGRIPLKKYRHRIAKVFGVNVDEIDWGEKRAKKP